MAANEAVRKVASKNGMRFLQPRDAMDALEAAVVCRSPGINAGNIISIMNVDWDSVLRRIDDVPYMLRGLQGAAQVGRQAGTSGPRSGHEGTYDNYGVSYDSNIQRVTFEDTCARILTICASIAGSEIGIDDPLMEHGIDSLGTVELQNAVNHAFKTSIDATTIFNFPSVRALSEHVASAIGQLAAVDRPSRQAMRPSRDAFTISSTTSTMVVITGII